ncbi:hypothetical protein SBA4_2350006 [Candidatus Sulfopaludibacter sp. SbA4]|nr:hypothetical protein SBA4_2350006 [Candidatus Sulfopaludibacter sp. SbA4]
MVDLFEIAANNRDALEARFSALLSSASTDLAGTVQRFADTVLSHGRVSVNMRPMSLLSFLVLGFHQNIYEWSRSRGEESGRPAEEIIREKLGDFYAKRVAFDRYFDKGETFRYGALNIGGPGATVYCDYCTILQNSASDNPEIAYLRSDSLKTYFKADGALDEAALREDAAPHSHRHVCACLKCAPELSATAAAGWAALLCSNSDFVEAVFSTPTTPVDVESVRIESSQYRELFRYGFENFREKLTDERRNLVEAFVLIKRLLRENSIPLEVA